MDEEWENEMRQFGDENTEQDIAFKNAMGKYFRKLKELEDENNA